MINNLTDGNNPTDMSAIISEFNAITKVFINKHDKEEWNGMNQIVSSTKSTAMRYSKLYNVGKFANFKDVWHEIANKENVRFNEDGHSSPIRNKYLNIQKSNSGILYMSNINGQEVLMGDMSPNVFDGIMSLELNHPELQIDTKVIELILTGQNKFYLGINVLLEFEFSIQ